MTREEAIKVLPSNYRRYYEAVEKGEVSRDSLNDFLIERAIERRLPLPG